MPIPFLFDSKPLRLPRVGRLRLGEPKQPNRPGPELPYFRLDDAPELAKALQNDQPTSIDIEFQFDNPELVCPYYLRKHGGGGLVCMGDGKNMRFRRIPQKDEKGQQVYKQGKDGKRYPVWYADVRDGVIVNPRGVPVQVDNANQTVPCPGPECPSYQSGECKPTGYLRFVPRMAPCTGGYYDVVLHELAIRTIIPVLAETFKRYGRLTDIPFILHRGEEQDIEVRNKAGEWEKRKTRVPRLEVNPAWSAANWANSAQICAESYRRRRLAVRYDILTLFDGGDDEEIAALGDGLEVFAEENYPGEDLDTLIEHGEFEEIPFTDPPEPDVGGDPEPEPTDATKREFLDAVHQQIPYFEKDDQVIKALLKHFPEQNGAFWGPGDTLILSWSVMYNALLDEAMGKVGA